MDLHREIAAVIEADIMVSLVGQTVTPAWLRDALIESVRTLQVPAAKPFQRAKPVVR